MPSRNSWVGLHNYYKRNAARLVFRRMLEIRTREALISFTFDDFPRSALLAGGAILNRHGLAGTYYTALGLLGRDGPSGPLYRSEDLKAALADGHELGCHTFAHCHSWETKKGMFEDSILQNRAALGELVPDAAFQSFSYPISEPRPFTKRAASKYFLSCRGGGQAINVGRADLNQLAAYFLEKSRDNLQAITSLIDANREAGGWLIFATHDVAHNPGPFGCTPEFFESVVRYAASSGARILPVVKALEAIRSAASTGDRPGN